MDLKYKKVLLKVSGEALAGKGRNRPEIPRKRALSLDRGARDINNTSALRAGWKSPPAVMLARRASPRAPFHGERRRSGANPEPTVKVRTGEDIYIFYS